MWTTYLEISNCLGEPVHFGKAPEKKMTGKWKILKFSFKFQTISRSFGGPHIEKVHCTFFEYIYLVYYIDY